LPGKYSIKGPLLINCNGRRKGRELLSHHGCCEDALEKAKVHADAARARRWFKENVRCKENIATEQS